MASSEVYKVVLSGGAPWGFRLQGGKEFRAPLRIAKITPGSKAKQANIYEGLYVQAINNHPSVNLTHSEAQNLVKKSGNDLELVLCWWSFPVEGIELLSHQSRALHTMSEKKVVSTTTFTFEQKPDSVQPSSAGAYTAEDINRGTHITRATFKPSSEAPSYATLPRGGQGWKEDVDENFNTTYVAETNNRSEWDPNIISNVTRPPEPIQLLKTPESIRSATNIVTEAPPHSEVYVHKGFDKPQPIGRGGRRFDEPSHESYGYKPPLTSSSIGSDEDFNIANGDSSSLDSNPHYASINRPAMNQFRKQKMNAEVEATKEPKPLPKKVPPPPPAKPERRYPNIFEQEKYKGPSRPAIKRGGKWYKEMFKEMHATAGASSNLSALLANDAVKAGEEHGEEGDYDGHQPPLAKDFVHPMEARPVESEIELSENRPSYNAPYAQKTQHSPTGHMQQVSPPGGTQQAHVPTWYQDMLKGEKIPNDEPLSYGVHRRQPSYDSGDDVKQRFSGPHPPVHANRPPDYVAPLSRSAADRPMNRTLPPTVTVQQEEKSKPPTAASMYESRFKGGAQPGGTRSAKEELGIRQPSEEELKRKQEEERLRREEERRQLEEEREMIRQQQEERRRREIEAEQRRRKLEAEEAARKEAARKAAERPQFFAMALYSFDAQNPKELSFKKGDYIIVKRQIDRNWIEGEVNGRIGIFPTNYVELRPIEDEEEEVESLPSPYVPVEGQAKVKYNFKAESAREISVGKGEIVTLTRRVDQNWYEGISSGRKGIMPAAYLEVLREPGLIPRASLSPKGGEQQGKHVVRQEEAVKKAGTPQVSHMPQQATEVKRTTTTTSTYDQRPDQPLSYGEPIRITHSGQPQSRGDYPQPKPQVQYMSKEPETIILPAQVVMDEHEMFPLEGERFKAAFSYRPQNDDELPLEEGEEVIVLEKCDDGWFVGHSIGTGLFGTFPGNYVVPLSGLPTAVTSPSFRDVTWCIPPAGHRIALATVLYTDDSNPNWREEVRNDLFDDEDDEIGASPREKRNRDKDAAEVDLDEHYDPELKEPAVKTVAQAVGLAEQ